jgi:hypothetical protein
MKDEPRMKTASGKRHDNAGESSPADQMLAFPDPLRKDP